MQAHERIAAAIDAATQSGRPGLIPFITAGYPDPRGFVETLKSIASVGDVVELGIPFSDPMADGMTIQRSSFEALQKGVSLKWIFEQLDSVSGEIEAPMVMMSYLNPLLAFGYEALAERALAAGDAGDPDSAAEDALRCVARFRIRGHHHRHYRRRRRPPRRPGRLPRQGRGAVAASRLRRFRDSIAR